MINPQIKALFALQQHDLRVVSLENKLAKIPKRIEEMDRDLEKLQAMLQGELDKLEETQSFRKSQEDQLADEEEHVRQSKSRLGTVKTPRELAAAQREIESTRRMIQARSEEIDKIDEGISVAKGRIDSMSSGFEQLKSSFDAERTKLTEEKGELETAIGRDQGAREALVKEVDRVLLRTYERIRRRGTVAFVPVRERRCSACRMQVAHQMYVSIRRGDEIHACESCGRLLYFAAHFNKNADAEPAAAG